VAVAQVTLQLPAQVATVAHLVAAAAVAVVAQPQAAQAVMAAQDKSECGHGDK
tara:strand:+ start:588 stop:746 length:159 start_codon:yes stop_codon:yes gene_type:complete